MTEPGASEADRQEQQETAVPGPPPGPRHAAPEADDYDVLEQQAAVPDDEDDAPR